LKFIKTNWDLPYYNFALESYLLSQAPEDDYFFLYVHRPSVIVGKHQNTLEEVDKAYVESHGIVVARRLSGGGAVYHDAGNVNFSFVQRAKADEVSDFRKYTAPVIESLAGLGIEAMLSGRNDILIKDQKISGNAQCHRNNRLLSHGTLLYDADMSHLTKALNVDSLKIESKGVKSVRSRVTNIIEHMEKPMTALAFKDYLQNDLIDRLGAEVWELPEEVLQWVEAEAVTRFADWSWNWGESPACDVKRKAKFPGGIIDIRLNISEGIIQQCRIYGDFFVKQDIESLEAMIEGCRYERKALGVILTQEVVSSYFVDMDAAVLADFITYSGSM
jgi:lipoate-protein ligase A